MYICGISKICSFLGLKCLSSKYLFVSDCAEFTHSLLLFFWCFFHTLAEAHSVAKSNYYSCSSHTLYFVYVNFMAVSIESLYGCESLSFYIKTDHKGEIFSFNFLRIKVTDNNTISVSFSLHCVNLTF